MRIATAEQMRTLDRRAIEERGVPSLELMERAANALAEAAIDTAANAPGRAVCFCGPGNNGGDGVACARLLLEAGFEVRCILGTGALYPGRPGLRGLVPEGGRDGGRHLRYRPEHRGAGGRPHRRSHDEHL